MMIMRTPPVGWVLLLCQLSKVDRSCWDQTQQRLGSAHVHHVIGRPVVSREALFFASEG